jgi:hypothetical protein
MEPTKGPWLIADRTFIYALNQNDTNIFHCQVQAGFTEHGRTSDEYLEATANMIAAAPDMLDALEKADKWVAMYLDQPGHDAAARSMLAVIRAATAKAKGELS